MGAKTKRRYKITRADMMSVLEYRLEKLEVELRRAIDVGHFPIIRQLTERMNNLRSELWFLGAERHKRKREKKL